MSVLDGSQTVLLTWTFLKLCHIPVVLTQLCHCGHTGIIPMTPCLREIRWQLNCPCELDSLLPIFSVSLGRRGSMSKVTDVLREKLHCKRDNKGRVKLRTLYKSYWATLKIVWMSNNFTTPLEELFVRYHTQAQAQRMHSKGWHIQNIDKKQMYKIKTFQRKDVKMVTSYQMHYCHRHKVNIWNGKTKKSLIVFLKACSHYFKKMWFQQYIWIEIQLFF